MDRDGPINIFLHSKKRTQTHESIVDKLHYF